MWILYPHAKSQKIDHYYKGYVKTRYTTESEALIGLKFPVNLWNLVKYNLTFLRRILWRRIFATMAGE